MSPRLHLRALPDPVPSVKPDAVYLVLRRENGHWSLGAKVMGVFDSEHAAETEAASLHDKLPQQVFGVFSLRSEARTLPVITEIVRINES